MFKMTHNILRNLVVKKSTRRYPFEVRETFDKVRGELKKKTKDKDAAKAKEPPAAAEPGAGSSPPEAPSEQGE